MTSSTSPDAEPGAAPGMPGPVLTAHEAQRLLGATPEPAPEEVRAQTAAGSPVAATAAPPRVGLIVATVIAFAVLAIALVLVIAYFLLALGPGFTFLGGLLALIPLAIVLLGVQWIDRWEPEPRIALLLAFLWGATASVLIALFIDVAAADRYAASGLDTNMTIFLQGTVQAPIVEEVAKGLGVLLIYLIARRFFDGPVDGIVYAAMVAAGFAFTENIQYFGVQFLESGSFDGAVIEVFFIRGILSPFAHVMFTACIGFAIGIAAQKGTVLGGILGFLVGLVPAILLHAFWNGVLFFIWDFYGYYLVVQVPLFLIAVGIVVYLRRREAAMTQLRLTEYATAGWFNPDEVRTLATWAGRRQAMAWARSLGIGPLMKEYIRDATHLAFTRNRIISGRDRIGSQRDEALLLSQIVEDRRALMAGAAAAAQARQPQPVP